MMNADVADVVAVSQDAASKRVAITVHAGTAAGLMVLRFFLSPSLLGRLTRRGDIPTGLVVIEVETPSGRVEARVSVARLEPMMSSPGGGRPGIRINTPSPAPAAGEGPVAAGLGEEKERRIPVRFAVSRGEAYQDTGCWLGVNGWSVDKVWIAVEATVEGESPSSGRTDEGPSPLPPNPPLPPNGNFRKKIFFAIATLILLLAVIWGVGTGGHPGEERVVPVPPVQPDPVPPSPPPTPPTPTPTPTPPTPARQDPPVIVPPVQPTPERQRTEPEKAPSNCTAEQILTNTCCTGIKLSLGQCH